MNLQPGIFYNGIDGFSIRAMEKDAEERRPARCADLRPPRTLPREQHGGAGRERGTMSRSTDGRYLILTLKDGHFYDEHSAGDQGTAYPMMRGTFAEDEIRLDLRPWAWTARTRTSSRTTTRCSPSGSCNWRRTACVAR
jgi:hypothetical protein